MNTKSSDAAIPPERSVNECKKTLLFKFQITGSIDISSF